MNIAEYTNYPSLYNKLELQKYNCSLWVDHQWIQARDEKRVAVVDQFLMAKQSHNSVDKILWLANEGIWVQLPYLDSRIHVWESMINLSHPRLHFWPWWCLKIKDVNQSINSLEKLSNPLQSSPEYFFDCLLGFVRTRLNRRFAQHFIEKNNLKSKMIYSCIGQNEKWISGHDFDDIEIVNSNLPVLHNDIISTASFFLPYKIFNNSWYSIVCETKTQGVMTEKTIKPLMSRRLFVFFGAANMLRGLKNLGFQTFDSVIDESYDQELNCQKRWTKATEQITFLLQQNPKQIYEKILPILIHNQRHVIEFDWNAWFEKSILDVVTT